MSPLLFIDIETIPSQKPGILEELRKTAKPPANMTKPETIAKWREENAEDIWLKTALDGAHGELVVIGWAIDDGPVQSFSRGLGEDEAYLLKSFYASLWYELCDNAPPQYVGHNILGFDLRFLYQRSVILGVQPAFPLNHDTRYNGNGAMDTMLAWAGWGNRVSLSKVCAALNIPVKSGGIDGSQVWPYVQAGRVAEVADYCREDVEATREVWRRMTFQGVSNV